VVVRGGSVHGLKFSFLTPIREKTNNNGEGGKGDRIGGGEQAEPLLRPIPKNHRERLCIKESHFCRKKKKRIRKIVIKRNACAGGRGCTAKGN